MEACSRDAFAAALFASAMFGSVLGSAAVILHRWLNPPDVEMRFRLFASAVGLLNQAVVEPDEARKLQLVERARDLTVRAG